MSQETDRQFKETDKKFQETDRQFKETDKKFQETDRQFKETEKMFKETDRQFKETDKKINKVHGLFTSQWGKLIESITASGCLNLFKQRGVDISTTYRNIKVEVKGVKKAEYDVILANGTEVVIVEVKTSLKVEHVKYLLDKLKEVKNLLKSFSDKDIYGAVAAISFDESSDSYAIKNGLFVIKNSGSGILNIDNDADFKPAIF
ncbi:MAG: hypothetical protein CSB01_00825 [Bacteroidia bacterium]|nr:MAG: hypothetical protein CSB01_00825 [Bacteroidia bacterium]